MELLILSLKSLIKPSTIVLVLILLLAFNYWLFKKIKSAKLYANILKNSIATFIILSGVIAIILTIPIDKAHKGQILSFLAIVVSAGIALSSTNVLGNLIAGIMNNSMNRFRNGDLIKIGDFQGRVTKTSIFHIEIQLEDSNFISIPNLFIATNPVKLTRKTDTVISISVSLGYEIPRTIIEESLKEAAILAGLTDPYVYITNLGDFSVSYKIHGFLEDSGHYFSTKSQLNAMVMDVLHQNRIEIVSPSFMNQRNSNEKTFIPKIIVEKKIKNEEQTPEDMIFDEAIKSENIETKKDELKELCKKKESLNEKKKESKNDAEIQKIESSINFIDEKKAEIEKNIEENNEEENK